MQSFKKLVSKIAPKSIFNLIIESNNPNQSQYLQAVQTFSQSPEKKQEILQSIFERIKKEQSTQKIISALLLVDYLSSLSPQITLFHNFPTPLTSKDQSDTKKNTLANQKIFTAEQNFIKFYFNYLKTKSQKQSRQINFLNCTIDQYLQYCEISVNQILQIIKIDFILTFLVKNSSNQSSIKLALGNILQKLSFDIKITNRFLEKYLAVITKKHELSFQINEIYQKVLFINSNFKKINLISRNLGKNILLEAYQIDQQLNKSIQMQLFQRADEKLQYICESRKKIKEQENEKECHDDVNIDVQMKSIEGDTMMRLNQYI